MQMKKNVFILDSLREIMRNKGRFISILLIVFLGAAFFAGIRSARYDMRKSADDYFDRQHLMDFRILSTLGLTNEDVSDIENTEGVAAAEGGYTTEGLAQIDGEEYGVKVIAETQDINTVWLEEGRLPEDSTECVVDAGKAEQLGISVGDTIPLVRDDGKPLSEDGNVTEDTFTVVGLGQIPYYLDLTRGSGSVGDGRLDFWMVIPKEVFSYEAYTEVYVLASGAEAELSYSDAYEEIIDTAEAQLEKVGDTACHRRYNELNTQLEDAKQQLADGKQQLADAEQALTDGRAELEEKQQELDDAKAQYEEGVQQLTEAKTQYAEGLAQYNANNAAYQSGLAQYQAGMAEYQSGLAQYTDGYSAYQQALPEYQAGLRQYESGLTQYNNGYSSYQIALALYQSGETTYASLQARLEDLKQQQEAGNVSADVVAAAEQALNDYRAQLDSQKAELDATAAQLAEAKAQLDAFEAVKTQMETTEATLNASKAQLDSAKSQLDLTGQQLQLAATQLSDAKKQLDDASDQITDGETELEDAAKQISDGETALEDGWNQLEEKQAEYDQAKEDSVTEFADAEDQIAAAEEELDGLEIPEWYILDRGMISSVASFGQDADRMWSLSMVFPAIFFLVAALVSLTAMTRMVEEQRTQIGTLKALGYSDGAITWKYLGYALSATLIGAIAGSLLGEIGLPSVIIVSYQMLYSGLMIVRTPINWDQTLLAVMLCVLCTGGATIMACYQQMKEKPAELMRPEAPKSGKRVLLERVTILWRHLSFNQKLTIRNLFRYKKRLIMMLLGIGGCMGLLLVGFGLKDSITQVALRQYVEIFHYDAALTLDQASQDTDQNALIETIQSDDQVAAEMKVSMESVDAESGSHTKTVYLFTPESTEDIGAFLTMQDRKTGEHYNYPEDGVALSEKTAKDLGLSVGDTFTIRKGDNSPVKTTVSSIIENYIYHYVFISPSLYEELFGEEPGYNQIYVNLRDTSKEAQDTFATEMMQQTACKGISMTTELEEAIDDMLKSLNMVIYVLIVSAGALAFVVLYNLNNINITERRRELATLKVLGFYDGEVAMTIYRENLILTFIGIAGGMLFGKVLHQFTIRTVEVELMMFGRTISAGSYAISCVIALGFALFVNLMMYRKIKKIDMIESLKSVE